MPVLIPMLAHNVGANLCPALLCEHAMVLPPSARICMCVCVYTCVSKCVCVCMHVLSLSFSCTKWLVALLHPTLCPTLHLRPHSKGPGSGGLRLRQPVHSQSPHLVLIA